MSEVRQILNFCKCVWSSHSVTCPDQWCDIGFGGTCARRDMREDLRRMKIGAEGSSTRDGTYSSDREVEVLLQRLSKEERLWHNSCIREARRSFWHDMYNVRYIPFSRASKRYQTSSPSISSNSSRPKGTLNLSVPAASFRLSIIA